MKAQNVGLFFFALAAVDYCQLLQIGSPDPHHINGALKRWRQSTISRFAGRISSLHLSDETDERQNRS